MAAVVAALFLAAGVPSAARGQSVRPLTTGFADDVYFGPAALSDPWFERTVASGAKLVLLDVEWAGIAPANRPPGFDPANPGDPAYSWEGVDSAVRAASRRGLSVALLVNRAPSWAEGPGRPAGAAPGSWRPDPAAFGRFAAAAARRYSGTYPDPLVPGATLPHVGYWQAWAEPNLGVHLAPQWVVGQGRFVPASPGIYRGLLNAFYDAVKAVDPANRVITAGTAPFGDPIPGGPRMPPARFVRELLCLRDASLAPAPCPDPAHFDILAHHPYSVGAPRRAARNRDDVSLPDLGKLTRPLAAALRLGRALPRAPKPVWVTEFSYDSNPPDPGGVPAPEQARWLEEAFYVLWSQGVDTVAWYLIRDQPPVPSYASSYQSGIYLRDGRPKPAARAFRFPFVVEPAGRGRVVAWGKSPVAGVLSIQSRRGARWVSVAHVPVTAGAVFLRRLALAGHAGLRATVGAETSLIWQT
ncbi:MAG: hypothetical protein QOF77_1736 [Solirubrobacteraceae bacterium]|nr:hypothetical protein [Solirubrobacteraceae bacterium]